MTRYDEELDLLEATGGTETLAVLREPHGMGRFVHMLVEARDNGVELDVMRRLPPRLAEEIRVRLVNPCRRCDTYLLQDDWVGSAYCSLGCCLRDRKHDFEYAETILQGFERTAGLSVCRACGWCDATPWQEIVRRHEDLAVPLDADRARHLCGACARSARPEEDP